MTPLVHTTTAELHAATEAEFVTLLNRIQLRSGLSVPEVARSAGLARSQAYSMLSVKRGKLPTRPAQVRMFVAACGLQDAQVSRVMELWVKLRDPSEPHSEGSAFTMRCSA